MKNIKPHCYLLLIMILTVIAPPVTASDTLAIEGYDPVAYFTLQKAQKGSKAFAFQWNNKTWWFTSEEHRDLFKKNPKDYAPQFSGFCANGLSDGHAIEANPKNWRIIEGKLYLFFSEFGRDQWAGDVKSLIQSAEETYLDQ